MPGGPGARIGAFGQAIGLYLAWGALLVGLVWLAVGRRDSGDPRPVGLVLIGVAVLVGNWLLM